MYRRDFLSILSVLPLHKIVPLALPMPTESAKLNATNAQRQLPERLIPGNTVAFTAPASPVNYNSVKAYAEYFQTKGLIVTIGDTITKQDNKHRYFSAPAEQRLAELNSFITDPSVKAIICGRGGYGCMQLLPNIDYECLAQTPKFIMGYSDITAMLIAVNTAGISGGLHGPVASSRLTEAHKASLNAALFNKQQTLVYPLNGPTAAGTTTPKNQPYGRLVGGNLSLLTALCGTPFAANLAGAILFIEDAHVQAHEVDRMLTTLQLAGQLSTLAAILVGKMKDIDRRDNFFPNKSFTIREIITKLAQQLNVCCFFDLPFGHVNSEWVFPLGAQATIDKHQLIIDYNS